MQVRAARQEVVQERRDPRADVFAVVQDEQAGPVVQVVDESILRGHAGVVAHPAAGEHGERQRRVRAGGGQLDEAEQRERAVPRGLDGEPGLAASARAGERHEPVLDHGRHDGGEFRGAADERGERRRQHGGECASSVRRRPECVLWIVAAESPECGEVR